MAPDGQALLDALFHVTASDREAMRAGRVPGRHLRSYVNRTLGDYEMPVAFSILFSAVVFAALVVHAMVPQAPWWIVLGVVVPLVATCVVAVTPFKLWYVRRLCYARALAAAVECGEYDSATEPHWFPTYQGWGFGAAIDLRPLVASDRVINRDGRASVRRCVLPSPESRRFVDVRGPVRAFTVRGPATPKRPNSGYDDLLAIQLLPGSAATLADPPEPMPPYHGERE